MELAHIEVDHKLLLLLLLPLLLLLLLLVIATITALAEFLRRLKRKPAGFLKGCLGLQKWTPNSTKFIRKHSQVG